MRKTCLLLASCMLSHMGNAQIMGLEEPVSMPSMSTYNYYYPMNNIQSAARHKMNAFSYAVQFYQEGNYVGAINAININISTFATSRDYYIRAMCYEELKDYKKAKKDYKKAWNMGFGNNAASGYYRMKNTLKEIHMKEKALRKYK